MSATVSIRRQLRHAPRRGWMASALAGGLLLLATPALLAHRQKTATASNPQTSPFRPVSSDLSQLLVPLRGIVQVATGDAHTCALTIDGDVKCWGWNGYRQLGDGMRTGRFTPVDVIGLTSGVAAFTAGFNHTYALTTSGGAKCWGRNASGQQNNGTTSNRAYLIDVMAEIVPAPTVTPTPTPNIRIGGLCVSNMALILEW